LGMGRWRLSRGRYRLRDRQNGIRGMWLLFRIFFGLVGVLGMFGVWGKGVLSLIDDLGFAFCLDTRS